MVVCAPLVARFVFGATPIGRAVQAGALAVYLGSALRDWRERRGIRKIAFRREFGVDLRHLAPMPPETREAEVRALVDRLNDGFTPRRIGRRELAGEVDERLTSYIAGITGQRVRTSVRVRGFALVGLALPFALGACDMLTGDVMIFRDTGVLEPHVIAHEFCHRKGYWRELEAQVLAYLALAGSGEPVLVQSALCERLNRTLRVLAGHDGAAFARRVAGSGLRPELRGALMRRRPAAGPVSRRLEAGMRGLYDRRMRLTGQNGVSDYDLGFTSFVYAFESSVTARQVPSAASAVHPRP